MSAEVAATSPAECWRFYKEELRVRAHGAITRTLERTAAHEYRSLKRFLQALGNASKMRPWRPVLFRCHGFDGRNCILPNGVIIVIQQHYYVMGVITDQWWHLHWPCYIDAEYYPLRVINLVHQIDTLKEVRALIAEYVRNDYTVPEGACTL